MTGKGFGQPQPTKIDKLVESVVRYCHKRHPEALDKIFDNLPVNRTIQDYKRVSQQVLVAALAQLQSDIETLSWFCGYFAGEINQTQDNHRPHHSIAELSKLLITSGMEPFADFLPYPGCRLLVINYEKFKSLPESLQDMVKQAFDINETSPQSAHQVNNALLQEFVVHE